MDVYTKLDRAKVYETGCLLTKEDVQQLAINFDTFAEFRKIRNAACKITSTRLTRKEARVIQEVVERFVKPGRKA